MASVRKRRVLAYTVISDVRGCWTKYTNGDIGIPMIIKYLYDFIEIFKPIAYLITFFVVIVMIGWVVNLIKEHNKEAITGLGFIGDALFDVYKEHHILILMIWIVVMFLLFPKWIVFSAFDVNIPISDQREGTYIYYASIDDDAYIVPTKITKETFMDDEYTDTEYHIIEIVFQEGSLIPDDENIGKDGGSYWDNDGNEHSITILDQQATIYGESDDRFRIDWLEMIIVIYLAYRLIIYEYNYRIWKKENSTNNDLENTVS